MEPIWIQPWSTFLPEMSGSAMDWWMKTILFFIYIPVYLAEEMGIGGLIFGWIGMWLAWALFLVPRTHNPQDPGTAQMMVIGLVAWPMFMAIWLYILIPMRLFAHYVTKKAEGR